MNRMILSVAALAAATVAMPASAAVIDFDNLKNTAGWNQKDYIEDGYKLSTIVNTSSGLSFKAVAGANSIDPDGASVTTGSGGNTAVAVSHANGDFFEFGSIDFGPLKADSAISTYKFVFELANGDSAERFFSFAHDKQIATHTATFADLGVIKSFRFSATIGGSQQFDNIVLNDVAAAVPEPATWAMMLSGFGLIGGATRRRRTAVRFA